MRCAPRRRGARVWLVAAAVAILLAVVVFFNHAGTWLVVSDALQPASAIVVFGGGFPYRAMGAARLYKDGWAREVWLTEAVDVTEELSSLGVEPIREGEGIRALERMGLPSRAIRMIAGRPNNTADEVRLIGDALRAAGGSTVILMTSKYHTRRVRAIWHAQYGESPRGIVRFTPDDPFQPERWWKSSGDAESVVHEWFGLLNVWTGSRVSSRPR